MIIRSLIMATILSLIFFVLGCSSMIRPEISQPVFYLLQDQKDKVSCSQSFEGNLRIWDFDTAEPFNRTQMAVVGSNGTVVFSRKNQWAALPGIMVADSLLKDLGRDSLFPLVLTSMAKVDTRYEMTGQVHRFCLRQEKDSGQAEIKAEITLKTSKEQALLFHKTYHLRSQPIPLKDPLKFVQAMNELVGNLSRQLQGDLCQVAKK